MLLIKKIQEANNDDLSAAYISSFIYVIDISKQPIEALKVVYVEYNEKDHFVYHAFRTKLLGDPGAVKINFNEHKGFTWVTPADALKMNLLQDEDACIIKDYFSQSN